MQELTKGIQLAGRYTLVRRLGGDTETQSWLARDRLTRASVALKISAGDPQISARLRAEWQTSIGMMHAHIVRAFEFHAESDVAFYSQQFVDGPDISAVSGSALADVLGPLRYVVDAIAYVHAKGLVHRDIKASNVLLDANGAPYLSDFGVSSPVGQIASGGSLIAQSPQSLQGQPAVASDDIFALGSLMFELISGRPPWPSESIAEAIEHRPAPQLRHVNGTEVAAPIAELVARMLDKNPGNRPTASAVGEELQKAGFEAQTARVDTSRPRAVAAADEVIESVESIRRPERVGAESATIVRHETAGLSPKLVGLSLAILVLVLIAVVFILPDNVTENDAAPAEEVPVVDSDTGTRLSPVVADSEGRGDVYVDPEVRKRLESSTDAPTQKLAGDDEITFSENRADYSGLDEEARARFDAEATLGELLSAFEVLENRGIEVWAITEHRAARDLYQRGDRAYLKKDFAYSEELYLGALTVLEPLYDRIEATFENAYAAAKAAFEAGDRLEALRLYELAVAVTPTHAGALAGYERARNLQTVLRLVDQGVEYEEDLDLDAALSSFEQALKLDNLWQPAHDGIGRVQVTRTKMEFDSRMTEGFDAIAAGDFLAARAAFRVAKQLMPESTEPADGLLQVDQGIRLDQITVLEMEAEALQNDEHWDAVVKTYEEILKVDNSLSFATEGLVHARKMSALHSRLDKLIAEPDRLSIPSLMQSSTMLVVEITTRESIGARLAEQRDELSRLLKRAATPLTVALASDNVTEIFIYKVGRMGRFMRKQVNLRPGTYVVVGSRPGYRDVRLEFRVAPEIAMEAVVIQCEEPI